MNKAMIIGNLGRDVEMHSSNDLTIAKFSIAATEKFKDKERTEWLNIVSFGKLAEICQKHLKKGNQVYIEGKRSQSVWEKDGETRYSSEIVASKMLMLGSGSKLGLNKVLLIGRLGADPEVRYTKQGLPVAALSLATNEQNGNGKAPQWHRIIALGKLAEICKEYLQKGRQIQIEGRFQTRSWVQNGNTRYSTEIIVSSMEMLGSKPGTSTPDPVFDTGDENNGYLDEDIPF